MTTIPKRYRARVVAFIAVAAVAACQSSDKLPPKGSTITVAANPATIPLTSSPDCLTLLGSSQPCGTADVLATVASELGVPLPDQDVRFSSTAGFLYTGSATSPVNAANIPIRTDRFGNASVNLITSTTATVTAKSGQATAGTLTINTVSGNLSTIFLNFDLTSTGCNSSQNLSSCSQKLCFTAQAVDAASKGVQGVFLNFSIQKNVLNGSTLSGNFSPSPVITDSSGNASSEFLPDVGTCPTQCSLALGKICQAEAIASTTGGGFQSNTKTFTVTAP